MNIWVSKKSSPILNYTSNLLKKKITFTSIKYKFSGTNKLNSLNIINNIYFLMNKQSNNKKINYYDTFYPLSYLTDTKNGSKRKIVQVQFSIPEKNEKFLKKFYVN